MRIDEQLTIQDYFKRANPAACGRQRRSHCPKASRAGSVDFSSALKTAKIAGQKSRRGRCLQDYFKNPVSTLRPWATQSALPVASRPKATPSVAMVNRTDLIDSTGATQSTQSSDADLIQAGIHKAAARYDLPPALIQAVIRAESNFEVRAVSPAGAMGLMQLMPATASALGVEDAFDIEQNIDGGARYLRRMLRQFNGDLKLALSAYNAGPGTVAKYNGHVPFSETQAYVARVLRYVRQNPADIPNVT